MSFIIKQCLGCLIFLGGAYCITPTLFSGLIKGNSSPAGSNVNYHLYAISFCVWIVIWNVLLYMWKRRSKKKDANPSSYSYTANTPSSVYMPKKMKVITSAILNMNPNGAQAFQNAVDKDPVLEEDLKELSNGWWGNLELACFTHINYQNVKLDLTYTSNTCTIPVYVLTAEGEWHVDPATGNFINGEKVLPAPVAVLRQQVSILHKIEEGAKIVPVILLMRGTIQDEEDVLSYLEQYGMVLAKFNESVDSEAPTLHQVLKENFAPTVTPVDTEEMWNELDERGEQEMLRKKQEANYAQDETSSETPQGE